MRAVRVVANRAGIQPLTRNLTVHYSFPPLLATHRREIPRDRDIRHWEETRFHRNHLEKIREVKIDINCSKKTKTRIYSLLKTNFDKYHQTYQISINIYRKIPDKANLKNTYYFSQ